ncbi:MAG: CpsB/CapC family capsule biosynthesis tyrosine phosphatase [Chloroflexota bacterium]|nr:CpsB/CapC family capsule biosynthesis tyrosine phosphatase [Chloroflexota bacterium]
MIDLHAHILPGLDDGAQSLEEALEMARVASADGVSCLVATPHEVGFSSYDSERVRALTAQLQEEVKAEGLPLRLVVGTEAYARPDLVARLRSGESLTLGGSRYPLIEFPLTDLPLCTDQPLFELLVAGFRPIIAHPARNKVLRGDPNRLCQLIENRALAQLTTGSLTGQFGTSVQKAAQVFLEHNLVHFLASDAHDPEHRPPRLSEGVAAAAEIIGFEKAKAMVTTRPEAVLADEPFDIGSPRRYRPRRWWLSCLTADRGPGG